MLFRSGRDEHVIAISAARAVVASSADDPVIAIRGVNAVISGETVDRVIAGRAVDDVVAVGGARAIPWGLTSRWKLYGLFVDAAPAASNTLTTRSTPETPLAKATPSFNFSTSCSPGVNKSPSMISKRLSLIWKV